MFQTVSRTTLPDYSEEMEILRRWREPVAITLLVATGVRLLAGIVAVAVLSSDDGYGSFATAALFEGSRAADTLLLLATAAVAMWCLLSPPTPGGRTIAALALIETVAAVLVSLAFGLMGLASDAAGRGIQFVQLLATLALPAVAAVLLLALLRSAPSAVLVRPQEDHPPAHSGPVPPPAIPATPPPLPPGWQPEQATGMVWQTAGEAAAGAPPTGWSVAGEAPQRAAAEAAGWQPIPGSGDQPDANRSS